MQEVFTWMEGTGPAQWVSGSTWAFAGLETAHFIGLILLVGSLFVVDLRLLGFAKKIPVTAVLAFIPIAMVGFGINLVTGTLFFVSDPFTYYPNLSFRLKMLIIILAGANAVWFKLILNRALVDDGFGNVTATGLIRVIALASIVLWILVIVFGRMIPYLK